ncbi:MAG: thioredoxin [Bacteroidales bacterium]|jgi:thioredoxin 1
MNYYFWIPVVVLLILLIAAFYKKYKLLKNMDQTPNSAHLLELTDATFKKTIQKGVTLVDFWAPWCMPCKIQGPIVNEVADLMHDKATISKINIDIHKRTASELGIRSIPTIIIFKDGKTVAKLVGAKTKNVLTKAVNDALKS